MTKSSKDRRQKAFDVTLPDTLHDALLQDFTSVLERVSSSTELPLINTEVGRFKVDWLRKNLLSKFQDLSTTKPAVRKSNAIAKWLKMEERNRTTNIRLRFSDADFGLFTSEQLFEVAARFIRKMIGPSPDLSSLGGAFTNGASTRVKRSSTAIADKYTGKLHCTPEAWSIFVDHVLVDSPLWARLVAEGICTPEFRASSEMFTVPKTSDIDRVACKEPEINMFLQRGVGDYFRACLRKAGCNLNDQTINRGLARRGSVKGVARLATLDLSSASDLISTSLVYRLLPLEWVMHLEAIRVKSTLIDGTVHELEMFSSMGNGFTFELESLLFLSLARATCYLTKTKGRVSVYGDDIILPCSAVGLFTKVLQFCGCIVNKTKSFSSGWFRESCGGHYYAGNDVTPFYIRHRVQKLPDLILFLNELRCWATNEDVCLQYADNGFHAVWKKYACMVPPFLFGGREDGSDYALITPDRPRKRLSRVQRRSRASQLGGLVYWLHKRPEESVMDPFETSYGVFDGAYVIRRNRIWNPGLPLDHQWQEEIFSLSRTQ